MAAATLGAYRLLEPVVTRALTVTWRAEHDGLGRTVLIKTLKPTVSPTSPFSQDLDREAKVLARVRHDGIVVLYDFVRTDEHVYLVLEDVGGWSLAEVLQRAGQVDPEASAAVALELARALGHAHDRGVFHKGLRPEVISVTQAGRVKITDFSGSHDARTASIPEPFEAGASLATPDYMAPEQVLGEDAGPETDVFAVGVLLHEMIAGARPFEEPRERRAAEGPAGPGATPPVEGARPGGPAGARPGGSPVARSTAPASSRRGGEARDVALRIRSAAPTPLGQLVPGAPRSIERVVLRCLAKRREDRYADGRALAAALEEALAERTPLPRRVLVSRAVAAAKLGEVLPAPGTAAATTPLIGVPPRRLAETARSLALVFVLIAGGGVAIELGLRREEGAGPEAPSEPSLAPAARGRAYLKVLARPWAEVYVDGELVEVTPVARPIPVEPGKRFVTFRHPYAPDEKRTVKVVAGQTVLLDVNMRVERPDAGAPRPDAGYSP